MKANELRIGNLVKDSIGVIEISITGESYFEKPIYDFGKIEFASIYEPILLTEKWLLKFGFEKKENGLFTKKLEYIYNSLKYCDDYKIWIYYNDDNDAACNAIADLNYVHELQNLYFALTKEELTMK